MNSRKKYFPSFTFHFLYLFPSFFLSRNLIYFTLYSYFPSLLHFGSSTSFSLIHSLFFSSICVLFLAVHFINALIFLSTKWLCSFSLKKIIICRICFKRLQSALIDAIPPTRSISGLGLELTAEGKISKATK